MTKVFVARKIPDAGIKVLKDAGLDVEVNEDPEKILSKKEIIDKIKDKDALLSLLTDKIDKEVLDSAPNLKIVANYAVGFDNIDIKEADKKGIIVTNTPDVLTQTVSEHTFALMMASSRRIVESDKFTREGKYKAWGPLLFLGQDFKGKTLGIIGLGRIGSTVAKIAAKGYSMKVLYNNRSRDEDFETEYGAEFVDIETLLKESDFITLHVPLTKETQHLISEKEFNMMKPTAVLVNTARGPIIDEKALVNALKNKRIAAAALDVFECEPDITCDKSATTQLKDMDNVTLTPHIASASVDTRNKMAEMAAQSIVDLAQGETPEHVVKPR